MPNPADHPHRSLTWDISAAGAATTAVFEPGADDGPLFVCAHGAGGHMSDRGMLAVTRALRQAGLGIVRFNFFYRHAGSRRPDPMPRLQDCFAAVVERARSELGPSRFLIGGRSMGGRAASMLAAGGYPCDGLLLLAYPLHPAGRPDTLRDAHLPDIAVPTLCINGTRDALCRRDLMDAVLPRISAPWTMHWIEGADHSFHVLTSSGRTDAQVLTEVATVARDWLDRVTWDR